MVNILANQNIDYAVTSRRKAFLISTLRALRHVVEGRPGGEIGPRLLRQERGRGQTENGARAPDDNGKGGHAQQNTGHATSREIALPPASCPNPQSFGKMGSDSNSRIGNWSLTPLAECCE